MTPLERLGLEVVAFTLLGSRSQAALLCALLGANGRIVSVNALRQAKSWRISADELAKSTVRVYVCQLRESLDDIGLGGVVETVNPHGPRFAADGYRVNSANRARVMERLVAEAAA